jgi:TatD DNase family protein
MIVDTHCHLDFKDFDLDRDLVLERAARSGVVRIINVGSSLEGTRRALELSKKYDIVYASVGIHPHDAASVNSETFAEIEKLAALDKVVAIGEVGLDYYRNLSPKDKQIEAFNKFIALALRLDLPLIIHSREADTDTISILKNAIRNTQYERRIQGVIHCFSGSESFLKACLDLGFYISFTCNLTFKKAGALRELAKTVPIEKVLLETDAPFLAPEGMRGKRNEPAYLTYLIEEWTGITGLSKEDIARITTHNANKLFNLGLSGDNKSRIAYEIRDSLYLNITNRCTNNCYFCVRALGPFVKGHNLKLDSEPAVDEILKAAGDVKKFREIAFCGYGEPTARLDIVKAVAKELKARGAVIRLITNGHGDLINKRPIVKELAGLIDKVSVSLNTAREEQYEKICKPEFGAPTYKAVVKFIKDCVAGGIDTEVTCLDLPEVDVDACAAAARSMGASFRQRRYGVTG